MLTESWIRLNSHNKIRFKKIIFEVVASVGAEVIDDFHLVAAWAIVSFSVSLTVNLTRK